MRPRGYPLARLTSIGLLAFLSGCALGRSAGRADVPIEPASMDVQSQPSQQLSGITSTDTQMSQDPLPGESRIGDPSNGDWWGRVDDVQHDWMEQDVWACLLEDQANFYFHQRWGQTLAVGAGAAVMANTSIDQEFSDWYQDNVRGESLDRVAAFSKSFGEQWPMVGLYVGTSMMGRLGWIGPAGRDWGETSFRAMLVGTPPLLLAQKLLGGSRPNDAAPGSDWNFWGDNNSVSGHGFVGAVPFLVAAEMSESRSWHMAWTIASTLPAWSRVNDNDHYLSQAILGWWIADLAVKSVQRTNDANRKIEVVPMIDSETMGVGVEMRR